VAGTRCGGRLRRALERDHGCADRSGGPCKGWTPLLYISFSRFQMENAESQARFTECARLLLDGGAEPNAAWEHSYWPGSPLRPLYGATGVNNNPSLARLLLKRGADVNDGESIYHAAQFDHRECMDVLAEFGVSPGKHPHWGNTPLYFLLGTSRGQGDWVATARGIRWLLDHGSDPNVSCGENHETALHVAVREDHDTEILGELLEAGADPNRADKNGVLPLTLAHRAGREDVVAALRKWGAHEVELTVGERFFEAALSGNRERSLTLVRENPGLLATFQEKDHPSRAQ
jgi:Ankyrin repeats (3 copies)